MENTGAADGTTRTRQPWAPSVGSQRLDVTRVLTARSPSRLLHAMGAMPPAHVGSVVQSSTRKGRQSLSNREMSGKAFDLVYCGPITVMKKKGYRGSF